MQVQTLNQLTEKTIEKSQVIKSKIKLNIDDLILSEEKIIKDDIKESKTQT